MANPSIVNPVFETMTTFKHGSLLIRVWREEPAFKMGPDEEVVERLLAVKTGMFSGRTMPERFVDSVKDLPRLSAIEVLDRSTKDGALFYPDWS